MNRIAPPFNGWLVPVAAPSAACAASPTRRRTPVKIDTGVEKVVNGRFEELGVTPRSVAERVANDSLFRVDVMGQ
jgi:hypothetical protein